MDKVLRCQCGFEARAEHEDELAVEVQRHASEAHGMAFSKDEALLLVSRAQPEHDAIGAQSGQRNRSRFSNNLASDSEEEE